MNSHTPVLLQPVIDALCPQGREIKRLIDGTLGAGGHTRALLEAGAREALAFDLDPAAIAVARRELAEYGERATLCHSSYLNMRERAAQRGWDQVDAILLDLGLSSMQLDDPTRGFALRHDAALDMRFDPSAEGVTARDLVNELAESELADLFYRYGDESQSRSIARAIVQRRPVSGTAELADIVASAKRGGRRPTRIHPATQVFQALRIAVNQELEALTLVLPIAVSLLRPGGRLAVISFHSLEDRIVKRAFRDMARAIVSPPGMASIAAKAAAVKLVNRRPIVAGAREIAANPRSRSAKLRIAEKLDCA